MHTHEEALVEVLGITIAVNRNASKPLSLRCINFKPSVAAGVMRSMIKISKIASLLFCIYFLFFMWAQVILMASVEYAFGYYWISWTVGVYDDKANNWSHGTQSLDNPLVRLRVKNILYWCDKYESCTVTE